MDKQNGSTSLWMASASIPEFSPLAGDIEADVCVIGAGIAGLTTAYLLSHSHKKVALIEAREVGSGESSRSMAHFSPPDERYAEVERHLGTGRAFLLADSYQYATNLVESIIHKESIDCEFQRVDGYLFSPSPDKRMLVREAQVARKLGLKVEELARVPGLSFDSGLCLRFPRQGQLHPVKYIKGLTQAFVRSGGRIYTHTRALEIQDGGRSQRVMTEQGTVTAQAVVVATNTPFSEHMRMHSRQVSYRTYVLGLQVPKGAVPEILLWDIGRPYYTVRLHASPDDAEHDILIVSGANHEAEEAADPQQRYASIEHWIRQHYPMAGAVAFQWSTQVMEPVDGLAYLGRSPGGPKNVYLITGDSGNGLTHSTLGALIVTDMITQRVNPWIGLFDPARQPAVDMSELMQKQAASVRPRLDWSSPEEVEYAEEIAAGEGAVLDAEGRKFAVHRDERGGLHILSAVCTHLGCTVGWNAAEKSWDCPCHGSRYDVDGTVLHGPATMALPAAELPASRHLPADTERYRRQRQTRLP